MTKKAASSPRYAPVVATPFKETAGDDVFNASEIVPIADSRFLFCDNNLGDVLLEMTLDREGRVAGPLVRRPLHGLEAGTVDDLEGMALAEVEGERIIFATPSLSLKQRKTRVTRKSERGKLAPARNGLLRVRIGEEARLEAELIPDFRSWLLDHSKRLRKSGSYLPDDGGLNVEGLAWDPEASALLFGIRTPVPKKGPMVARVRVKDPRGDWSLDNLEYLPPVHLQLEDVGQEQGIRSMEYFPALGGQLVVTGNSTSKSKAPFRLHLWDGNAEGKTLAYEEVRFSKEMKAEGVTSGTVEGRGVIVFVDDGGGYSVLFEDDPRLQIGAK